MAISDYLDHFIKVKALPNFIRLIYYIFQSVTN